MATRSPSSLHAAHLFEDSDTRLHAKGRSNGFKEYVRRFAEHIFGARALSHAGGAGLVEVSRTAMSALV